MARILILQQDMLHSDSRISTGGGLRARALGEGLSSRGHEVFYSLSHEIFSLYSEEERELYGLLWHSPGNIENALKGSNPDIIILQWLGSFECLRGVSGIPIVIDLVAPRLLELYHRGHPLEHEIRAKSEALSLGDFYICSNERQWYYFLPFLTLAGESNGGDLLKVVPVSAPVREPAKREAVEAVFVWGGVSWPWNKPLPFLNIISDEIKSSGSGRLILLSGRFPYQYGAGTRFSDWERELKLHSGVERLPLLSYGEMARVYLSANVAIDISADLPERRLASPFRTKDYLSCGLPLITADFMEISSRVREYGAGWIVDSADLGEFRRLVKTLIDSPELLIKPGKRARQLLGDHFTFEKAIEPLHRFCLNPSIRQKKRSLFSGLVALACAERLGEISSEGEAQRILESEESLDKNLDSLHHSKGLLLLKTGNLKSAREEFVKESELFPRKVQPLLKIGRIDLEEGLKPETLLPGLESLLEKYPGEENIRFELALLNYLMGEKKRAKTLFDLEISLFQGKVFKIYHMGSELKKRGLFSESLSCFKSLISRTPSDPVFSGGSHFHMGEIYLERGDLDLALPAFKSCIELLPAHRKAGEYIGQFAETG